MKIGFSILFTLLFAKVCFAQTDTTTKPLVWDIQPSFNGTIMYLDVPYIGHADTIEYLTLNVSKNTGASRPAFISVMMQSPIDQQKGMFLTYSKPAANATHLEPQQELTTKMEFQDCNSDFCTVRIIDGFAKRGEKKQTADIFSEFLKYDYVMFLFFFPDGSHKSVAVPLKSFQQQWKTLK
ncbi:MAG TPA: hypothetical protein VFO76_04155 [Candidatus Kapabacteria bacterium]|nr:hypothetical protein [Candidatus Kapabacteria bacterium]